MPDGLPSPSPRRPRRPRCNFHFKIDEMLRPEHRENYLALVRSPHMRVDDAHAWLLAQGYQLSRSAVARHRRRLLLADGADGLDLRRAAEFARVMSGGGLGAPPAADFVAGAHVRFQQLVFDRLVDLQTPTEKDRREGRVTDDDTRVIPAKELLEFAKLVAQCVELEHQYVKQLEEKDRADERRAAQSGQHAQGAQPRTDEEIRQGIEDIMRRRA
jgi:hypothetical protein